MEIKKIQWIIAHEPAYLFYRVANDFKQIINTLSQDIKIDLEILTAEEYNDRYQPSVPATKQNLWRFLRDNTVQIAQMQTTSLAKQFNPKMYVYDMPYLFNDHDHAADVLEGEIGVELLNSFTPESRLKGLAYTYSGGFRLMPFKDRVSSLGELAGQSVRSGMSPIMQETVRTLGFNPVPTEIEEVSSVVKSGQVVGAEHVAQRLLPDQCENWMGSIIDTEHSLFLTSIVVNLDWWDSLDTKVQNLFLEAARQAARNERDLSIRDGEASLANLQSKGVNYIKLDNTELDKLRDQTKSVYKTFENNYFDTELVEKIRKH